MFSRKNLHCNAPAYATVVTFVLLVAALSPAHSLANRILLENRTYTPLNYRIRTPAGKYSPWRVVLPGNSYQYTGHARLSLEVWHAKNQSEHFNLYSGNIYALERTAPRARPRFVFYKRRFRQAPRPPAALGSVDAVPQLAGTNWVGRESLGGYGRLEFRFAENGYATMIDAKARVPGYWSQNRDKVTLRFYSGKCVYNGTVLQREMYGSACNGKSNWAWNITRQGKNIQPKALTTTQQFGPLEKHIAYCEEQNIPYKLSLKKFAADCSAAQKRGRLPDQLRFVRGFTWFFGYLVDDENSDVILLGVKDPTRPPIDVDCLATAIKASYSGKTPYCSLEGHHDPRYQKSIVDGVPWNTRWAEIMILADYDMKRLSQGRWKPSILGFRSKIDIFGGIASNYGIGYNGAYSDRGGKQANFSDRFWFNFNSNMPRSVADYSGSLVYLYRNPVRVSTEQEVNGKFGTKNTTWSARLFAESFTRHMDALGKYYWSISELQSLYRMYDLMKHLREVSQSTPPGMNYWAYEYRHPYKGPAAAMPTLTVSRKVRQRSGRNYRTSTWTVRGGVQMRIGITRSSIERTRPNRQTVRLIRGGNVGEDS